MKQIKNPWRGYRKYLKHYCEICDIEPHPSLLEAHHIVEQSTFRNAGKRVIHGENIASLCANHHKEVTMGKIEILGRVATSSGKVIMYRYDDSEEVLFGKRGNPLTY